MKGLRIMVDLKSLQVLDALKSHRVIMTLIHDFLSSRTLLVLVSGC